MFLDKRTIIKTVVSLWTSSKGLENVKNEGKEKKMVPFATASKLFKVLKSYKSNKNVQDLFLRTIRCFLENLTRTK